MKSVYRLAGHSVFVSHFVFAGQKAEYLNGSTFEDVKPVQMVGIIKTDEDVERESQISRVVEDSPTVMKKN